MKKPTKASLETELGKDFIARVWVFARDKALKKFRNGELQADPIFYIAAIVRNMYEEEQGKARDHEVTVKPSQPTWVSKYKEMFGESNG